MKEFKCQAAIFVVLINILGQYLPFLLNFLYRHNNFILYVPRDEKFFKN